MPLQPKQIGDEAFANCEMLTPFPEALSEKTEVGKKIFNGCKQQ